jgi:hypothetical protein
MNDRATYSRTLAAALVSVATLGCATNSTIPFHEETLTNPNAALIYLYREWNLVGSGATWRVYVDGRPLGILKQDAYMTLHVTPGTHTIQVGGKSPIVSGGAIGAGISAGMEETIGAKLFSAKPAGTYYFRCRGLERAFLTRAQAIDSLRTMMYDRGQDY